MFYAESLYRKSPKRIMASIMVMTLSLLREDMLRPIVTLESRRVLIRPDHGRLGRPIGTERLRRYAIVPDKNPGILEVLTKLEQTAFILPLRDVVGRRC